LANIELSSIKYAKHLLITDKSIMPIQKIDDSIFLPSGEFNNSWLEDEGFGSSLQAYADQTRLHLEHIEPLYRRRRDYDVNFPFESIIEKLKCFRWAHPIEHETRPTGEIDRTMPMLLGPLFTSKEYPWPRHKRKFRAPLCQFDLEAVGSLQGVDLGSGLLQLWLGSSFDDYEARVIPKSALQKERITPVPDGLDRDYFKKKDIFSGDFCDWSDSKGEGKSVAITGIKTKILTWPNSLKQDLDDLAYNVKPDHKAVIEDFLKCLADEIPRSTPHFFGNFSPIQYSVESMPPCLIAFESNGPFYWGDGGNAQIFYIKENENARFIFEWSCP